MLKNKYNGDERIRSFSCLDQYYCMVFAQLTYRESLRDIDSCLNALSGKLYHMGIRGPVRESTIADANENRDWRIYAEFAQILIVKARRLYADEDFGLDLDNAVYAFDSTTIDLCLNLFPWARFRKTKAAVKMHTLLDIRGSIPVFVSITDGSVHDVNVLDELILEPGAFYLIDRGYLDFKRLYRIIRLCPFSSPGRKAIPRCVGCILVRWTSPPVSEAIRLLCSPFKNPERIIREG